MTLDVYKNGKVESVQVDSNQLFSNSRNEHLTGKYLLIAEPFTDQVTLLSINSATYSYIYDPSEAIAGFLKVLSPDITGDVQVLDIVDDHCYSKCITFDRQGRFVSTNKGGSIGIEKIVFDALGNRLVILEHLLDFLQQTDSNGEPYARMVMEALHHYQSGQTEYDDIFQILDQPSLNGLKLSKLVLLKDTLFEMTATNPNKPYLITGVLGIFFGQTDANLAGKEKIFGTCQIQRDLHRFYVASTLNINVNAHVYPLQISIPVVQQGDDYEVYANTMQFDIFDNGNIEIECNGVAYSLKTQNTQEIIPLNIFKGGGQNIFVGIGGTTYMVS